MRHQEWYERTFPELTGGGLWLRGGEWNTLPAEEFERRSFRVLFARLSTYFDTADSFTHPLLYQLAAETPEVFPDLAYLPPRQDLGRFERDHIPWLLGTGTKRDALDFDLVGFSPSIVQELLNLPRFLETSGIPQGKRERMERADIPLLLLGGASAQYTSLFWNQDAWVDLVFVGESTRAIQAILETCRDAKREGLPKQELARRLALLDGVFAPDQPVRARKASAKDLQDEPTHSRGPMLFLKEPATTAKLALDEGCPCFCSFCAEGWSRKPYRIRSASKLLDLAREMKVNLGVREIELHSFNFNAHPELYRLVWELLTLYPRLHFKSQRVDLLARDPRLLPVLKTLGKTSLTLGIEGISGRLRRYLHKNLTEGDILSVARSLFEAKARELKVFLIATGLEQEEDFAELGAWLEKLRAARQRAGARTRVVLSMTPLVRFPSTPQEFEDAFPVERLGPILRRAEQIATGRGLEFRAAADLGDAWVSQILVRSTRPEIGRALTRALGQTGFVYHRAVPKEFTRAFSRCLAEEGQKPPDLLAAPGPNLPWEELQTGVDRDFLREQAARARRFEEIPHCLSFRWQEPGCAGCGACAKPADLRELLQARADRPYSADDLKARVRGQGQPPAAIPLLFARGRASCRVPFPFVGMAVASAILRAAPELVGHLRGVDPGYWSQEEAGACLWLIGDDAVRLLIHPDGLAAVRARFAQPGWIQELNAILGDWGAVAGLATADFAPRLLVARAPFAFDPRAALDRLSIKYTQRRLDPATYRIELSPRSAKNPYLGGLAWSTPDQGGAEIAFQPRRKLDPVAFLGLTLALPAAGALHQVKLQSLGEQHPDLPGLEARFFPG